MGFASRLGESFAGATLAYGLSGQPALAETPSSAQEQVVEIKKMRVTEAAASNGGLNLRAAPNRNGEVLGKIPVGTEVTVTRVDGDWAEVTFTFAGVTETGWAAIQLGEVDYLEHAVFKMHVTEASASNGGLNLRAAPNKDGEILGKIPIGTEVTVLGVDGDWAKVSYTVGKNTKEGWAAMQLGGLTYLEKIGGVSSVQKKTKTTLNYIASEYYGQPLGEQAIEYLCDLNQTNSQASVVGTCDKLQAGSKVVFPTPRELNYALCVTADRPELCRTTYQLLSEKETEDQMYKALDAHGRACVANLRWDYPTKPLPNLVLASAMVKTYHGTEPAWETNCEDLDLSSSQRDVAIDYATLDKKGEWEITVNWR